VVTWGKDNDGGDTTVPTGVAPDLTNVQTIYSTKYAFAAVKSDGSVVTWGHTNYGGNSSGVTLTDVAVISYGKQYYQGQYYTNTVPIATLTPPPPQPPAAAPICFPAGTPVTTDQGSVAIEKLNPDKHTIRGKEIIAITQSRPLQKHIVCFEKDSLSKNVPSQQTLCSKNHAIFYKGEMVKARNIVDMCENVTLVDYNGETLYNVLLKKHDKMMINNLICETLDPKNIMAKISTMKDGQKKNKAIQVLTKIIKENNIPEYQKLYASLK
jgi:hypothetical protein